MRFVSYCGILYNNDYIYVLMLGCILNYGDEEGNCTILSYILYHNKHHAGTLTPVLRVL